MTRTHLLVAPGRGAFGELLLGLRLARELHARGDRVHVLAPAAYDLLLADTPFAHGHIDRVNGVLHRALPELIRARGCDSVILCDLLAVMLVCASHRVDPGFLDTLPAEVTALDIWDLRSSGLAFDMGDAVLQLPETARTLVPRRLVPVPFARRDVAGGYCALPATAPLTPDERTASRAALGLDERDRLVVMTTASYQTTGFTPAQARAAALVPRHLVERVLAQGDAVRVLHIGPRALDGGGSRYQHRGQVPPAEFRRLLGAADLYVTPNQAATSLSTALVLGVPALAVISTLRGEASPIGMPFRAFPIGLHDFMAPIFDANDYPDAVPAVELFPGDELDQEVAARLEDPAPALTRAQAYCQRIRLLPSGPQAMGSLASLRGV